MSKHEFKVQSVTWHMHQIADGLMKIERDGWEVFQMIAMDTQFGYTFTLILRRTCRKCNGIGTVTQWFPDGDPGPQNPKTATQVPCPVCSK
jgi:hypothetical protein